MKRLIVVLMIVAWAMVGAANSVAEITSFVINATRGVADITYDLQGEDAIVTLDVQRKDAGVWASIGGESYQYVAGDVNRMVAAGTGRRIHWPMTASGQAIAAQAGELKVVLTVWPSNCTPDYMVCDLTSYTRSYNTKAQIEYYASAEAMPGGVGARVYKTDKLVMKRIPAAGVIWRMGHTSSDDPYENYFFKAAESPAHYVTFTSDYYLGVYEFTQEQYRNVWGGSPSRAPANNPSTDGAHPVESLCRYANVPSYNLPLYTTLRGTTNSNLSVSTECSSVMYNLKRITGIDFDLPTVARWEYACRAGSGGVFYDGSNCPTNIAVAQIQECQGSWATIWKGVNVTYTTHKEVGSLMPNAFGLYDMLGNVSEIMREQDDSDRRAYPDSTDATTGYLGSFANPEIDPFYEIPEGKGDRCFPVIAGGCWRLNARLYCRAAASVIGGGSTIGEGGSFDKAIGFRVMAPASGCGVLASVSNDYWCTYGHTATPITTKAEAVATTSVNVRGKESASASSAFRFLTTLLKGMKYIFR